MTSPPFRRKILYVVSMVVLGATLLEILSTVFIYQVYHPYISDILDHPGRSATGFLLARVHSMVRGRDGREWLKVGTRSSVPAPYLAPDSLHGYRINPGRFSVSIRRERSGTAKTFRFQVTVDRAGARYTGAPCRPTETDVYIFGDSFVFGDGVNDEQTFTYLLQTRFPHARFHLHALPGGSLANAYLNVRRLADAIGSEDIVILGYGSFYDIRHVAAPSRMRQWPVPPREVTDAAAFRHVRARLADDSLVFDRIPLHCRDLGGYCEGKDPSRGYMDTVTAKLVNGISENTRARVWLLHLHGPLRREITDMLHPGISIVHASAEDFDYDMRDDIMGFDAHPGPYWHHAIYSRLSDTLGAIGLR